MIIYKQKNISPLREKNDQAQKTIYKEIPLKVPNNISYVKKYLIDVRCIDVDIVNHCIEQGLLYADKYSNCVFVNGDRTFSSSRGSGNTKFIQCLGTPDFISYGSICNTICLFESPIDALSYFDIYRNFIEGTLISTNGEMMITKVIDFGIQNNVVNIYTCFDNDKKGDEFHNYLKDEIIKKKLT